MKRILTTAFLAVALPALALAQSADGFDTEVRLDSGNIELAVIDGTTISVAAGSHLTIDPANGPGEVTRINVLNGEFRISNVFHKHSDVVLIRTGEHTFELNRGSALITFVDSSLFPNVLVSNERYTAIQFDRCSRHVPLRLYAS